jgi:hypothetical protein
LAAAIALSWFPSNHALSFTNHREGCFMWAICTYVGKCILIK